MGSTKQPIFVSTTYHSSNQSTSTIRLIRLTFRYLESDNNINSITASTSSSETTNTTYDQQQTTLLFGRHYHSSHSRSFCLNLSSPDRSRIGQLISELSRILVSSSIGINRALPPRTNPQNGAVCLELQRHSLDQTTTNFKDLINCQVQSPTNNIISIIQHISTEFNQK